MAIAFDTYTAIANWSSSNPATGLHTCTGTERFLWVTGFFNSAPSAVSATYNGVSLTQVSFFNDGTGNWQWTGYLIAPATGSNTLSVTRTGGGNMSISCSSYTGVDQTTPIDDSATDVFKASSTSHTTASVTVGNANNWLINGFRNVDGRTITSSTATFRGKTSIVIEEHWDSNGTVATGTQSITYTLSPAGRWGPSTLVSLAAAAAAGGDTTSFFYMN